MSATSENWKDKATGERKERTEWHTVVLNSDGLVGVAERYLRKGSKVYIEGQLRTRKWQDQSGNDRYTTEVVLQGPGAVLTMLDGAGGGGQRVVATGHLLDSGGPAQHRGVERGGCGGVGGHQFVPDKVGGMVRHGGLLTGWRTGLRATTIGRARRGSKPQGHRAAL